MDIQNLGIHADVKTRTDTCETHGQYEAKCFFRNTWSKCPACQELQKQEEAAQADKRDREEKQRAWEKKIGRAGIPARFIGRTLDNYLAKSEGQRKALIFATEYANTFHDAVHTGRSAIFCGRPGTGKTHLAIGIGTLLMREGRTVLFTTVMRSIRRVKSTWARGSEETETQAVASLVEPDLLILDEVGVQYGSDSEKIIMFDILNERYENARPTIMISNLPIAELKGFIGDRIFDRMRESGGEFVSFDWGSYRGEA